MWLFNSSIGKKFIMALTGICLVLFVTFHVLMNAVAIWSPVSYNKVCEFLGANWYALIASAGLGLLVVIHIIDALVLTIQNRKARGDNRYNITAMPKDVEWSSKNMLVLGFVVLIFLGIHLWQFWARMQAQEVIGAIYNVNGVDVLPVAGTLFIQIAFQEIWTPIVYVLGFIALWFHMNHGFWSMFQTIGWNNDKWMCRLKCIGGCWVSIVIFLFIVEAGVFTWRAMDKYYVTDPELKMQYNEMYQDAFQEELKGLESQYVELSNQQQALQSDETLSPEEKYMKFTEINQAMEALQTKAGELHQAFMGSCNDLQKITEKPAAKPAETTPQPEANN